MPRIDVLNAGPYNMYRVVRKTGLPRNRDFPEDRIYMDFWPIRGPLFVVE